MLKPKPFLRWAGGKTQLLPELLAHIPSTWNRETDFYVEPFVGAGALFWELQPAHAILNDANEELINIWHSLQCRSEELISHLCEVATSYAKEPEKLYYELRNLPEGECRTTCSPCGAARTIFLNKAGFNGIYRVNAKGGFNVPWGHNPKANVCDEANLRACAQSLKDWNVDLRSGDFADAFPNPAAGSLVYLDPPYVPVSKTSNFTAYTVDGFKYVDQLRLVQYAVWLRDCGCHVMLSQAADEILIDQYRRCGFKCDLVQARRSVNSKGGKRGPVGEYIIYGGK